MYRVCTPNTECQNTDQSWELTVPIENVFSKALECCFKVKCFSILSYPLLTLGKVILELPSVYGTCVCVCVCIHTHTHTYIYIYEFLFVIVGYRY